MAPEITATESWSGSRRRVQDIRICLLPLMPLAFIGFSVFLVYERDFNSLWISLPAAVGISGLVGLSKVGLKRRLRLSAAPSGVATTGRSTTFGTAGSAEAWTSVILASGIVGCTAVTISAYTGAQDYFGKGWHPPFDVTTWAFILTAAFVGRVILRTTGHLRALAVSCEPETVTFLKSFREWTIRWEDIDRIVADSDSSTMENPLLLVFPQRDGQMRSRPHGLSPAADRPETRAMAIKPDHLEIGPEPLHWFLRHYLAHPEHRPELGDDRARRRLLATPPSTR